MGKQQVKPKQDSHEDHNKNNQTIKNEKKQQMISNNNQTTHPLQVKKKIIKKIPFKAVGSIKNSQDKIYNDNGLSDWKPTNLENNQKQISNDISMVNSNKPKDLASQFLSFLPKPKQSLSQSNNQLIIQSNKLRKRQQLKKPMLLLQQKQYRQGMRVKWDGEDDFLNKPIQDNLPKDNYPVTERRMQQQQNDDEMVVEKIEWLNEKYQDNNSKNKKIKQLCISQLVDKSWQKQQQQLNHLLDDELSSSNSGDNRKKKTLKKNLQS